MKNTWLMALVVSLVLSAAACKKEENKAQRLAALDNAYQAGVLSKAEYDAKRLALAGPPPAQPAAPVAPPPVANPTAPPQNSPSATPPASAAVEVPPASTPPPAPKPAPHKRAPVATQLPAAPPTARQAAPLTSPPVAPQMPVPAPQPEQPRPAPQSSVAGEAEPAPLAGCEDTEYKSGSVKGVRQRFYPAPPGSVITAARAALRSLDFIVHQDTGNDIEASKRRHMSALVGAGGERLILHFEMAQQDGHAGTMATGETRKSFVGKVAQKSWTNAVLAQIACHLRDGR